LDHVTVVDRSVATVEDEIEAGLDALRGAWGISADGVLSPAAARLVGPGRARPGRPPVRPPRTRAIQGAERAYMKGYCSQAAKVAGHCG
jgi:hypothetical protein